MTAAADLPWLLVAFVFLTIRQPEAGAYASADRVIGPWWLTIIGRRCGQARPV
ncbi:hypothetical protein [Catenulispora subtropica]|uniref:hypothetical protein n=1 Tax=Catenulispora subtropica TaxID=450798 RepID=UPI0031DEEF71